MVQALICAQDWLRPSSRLDIEDYFEELRDLDKGIVQFFISFLIWFMHFIRLHVLTFNFLFFLLFILDLGKLSVKDNVIDVADTLNN